MESNSVAQINIKMSGLPSGGKAYPPGSNVSYRTYTFGEVQKTSISKNVSYPDTLRMALSGITTNFPPTDLTVSDLLYLAIARKLSTLGSNEFEIRYKCSGCKTSQDAKFKQADITFNDMKSDSCPLELELEDGTILHMEPMRARRLLEVFDGKYSKFIKDPYEAIQDRVFVYALMCTNMDFETVYTKLYSLTNSEDQEALQEVDKLLFHDMEPIKSVCSNSSCGKNVEISLEGRESLIRPFRDGGLSLRRKIRPVTKHEPKPLSNDVHGVQRSDSPTREASVVPRGPSN